MRKTSIIQGFVPWLVWLILITTLAMIGSRRATPGPVWNPRSLTAQPKKPAPPSGDCRGDGFQNAK